MLNIIILITHMINTYIPHTKESNNRYKNKTKCVDTNNNKHKHEYINNIMHTIITTIIEARIKKI